jgi:hypothetical protein
VFTDSTGIGSLPQITWSPLLTAGLGPGKTEIVKTFEIVEQNGLFKFAISCAALTLK